MTEITQINDGVSSIINGHFHYEYPPIVVAWASSDLAKFTPKSAPLRAYQAASSTIATVSSAGANAKTTNTNHPGAAATDPGASSTSSSSPQHTSNAPGLSTGAEAGIGVGVALGVLVVIGLILWALFERRKRRKPGAWPESTEDKDPSQTTWFEKRTDASEGNYYPTASTYEKRAGGPVDEDIPQSPRYEMHGESMRHEMDSDSMRAEMPAGHGSDLDRK